MSRYKRLIKNLFNEAYKKDEQNYNIKMLKKKSSGFQLIVSKMFHFKNLKNTEQETYVDGSIMTHL